MATEDWNTRAEDKEQRLFTRHWTRGGQVGRQLKVVRLLEPEMCTECRFAHTADVEMENGSTQPMIYCRRLDCDNWDIVSAEPAKSIQLHDEAA